MAYHRYIDTTINNAVISGYNVDLLHIIIMDSDTFWSVNHVSSIWPLYDCIRGDKDIIVSTELGCWMGTHCNKNDTDKWYPSHRIMNIPSFSVFVNSGVVMGKALALRDMLAYILRHNESYLTHNIKKKPPVYQFHDQHAIADYAIRVNPDAVALDYYQQFVGSFGIEIAGGDKISPVVCKGRDGNISYHCKESSMDFYNKFPSSVKIHNVTCAVSRKSRDKTPGHYALKGLSPSPLIWHGNGKAKKVFLSIGHSACICHIKRELPDHNVTSLLFE